MKSSGNGLKFKLDSHNLDTPGHSRVGAEILFMHERRGQAGSRRDFRPGFHHPRWRLLPLGLLAVVPATSFGQLKVTTRADFQFQDSSNVFDLSPGETPPTGNGDKTRADTFEAYGAGLNTTYNWSRQTFTIDLDARQFHYNHFSDLDHDDYRLTADWEWKLGRILDGSVSVNRGREMVAFSSFIGTQLSLETNQNEHATLNVQVTPDWRLETGGNSSRSDSPRPGLPDLSLQEDTLQAAVKYVGHTGLTLGVIERYTTGTYEGAVDNTEPGYHEVSGQFLASYLAPRSSFDMNLGYTSRESASAYDQLSGFTGRISYQYTFTPKTNAKLELSRNINSYITNAGSEIDTAAALHLNWQATHKIAVQASYSYTYSELPHQGFDLTNRLDHYRIAELDIDYHVTRLFELRPYARYETRGSDTFGAAYGANIYGVYGYLRWQALGPP
jgi:hypothetical protein